MEARSRRTAILVGAILSVYTAASVGTAAQAAGFRTANFTISAPTPELAREIGEAAEKFRKELAVEWLGKEMPDWSRPCPITAQVSPGLGAGGATSFMFDRGHVYGWRMRIQGSRERILDSVLPHEVTHTIFASHFRQRLPRWADEGACTTVEHRSEKAKHQHMLIRFLKTKQGIPFSQLFAMKEYPPNVMPLYSQGFSLARYLIQQGGKRKFLEFVGDGLQDEDWPRAVREQYGYDNLWALQNTWLDWVRQGSPQLTPPRGAGDGTLVAQNDARLQDESGTIYRAQSEDRPVTRLASASRGANDQPRRPMANRDEPVAERGEKLVPVRRAGGASVYAKATGLNVQPVSHSRDSVTDQAVQHDAAQRRPDPAVLANAASANAVAAGDSIAPKPASGADRSASAEQASRGPRGESAEVLIEWRRDSSAAIYDSSLPGDTVWR